MKAATRGMPAVAGTPSPSPRPDPSTGSRTAPARDAAGLPQTRRIGPQTELRQSRPAKIAAIPLRYAGKLFFKLDGEDYFCGGAFIDQRVVLTAATCLQNPETGAWAENVEFSLGYENDNQFEGYTAECFGTLGGWTAEKGAGRFGYDFAMVLVDKPTTTGHFGWHYGWAGDYGEARAAGYTSEVANGNVIQVVRGPVVPIPQAGIAIMAHSEKRIQSSMLGAPWIANYATKTGENTNYVIGVSSFAVASNPGVIGSPYVGENFKGLLDWVNNGCKE